MENLLILAAISTSISFTVTVTGIFKPLREFLSPYHTKIEELLHCPFCFGTWVTFAVVALAPNMILPIATNSIINFFLNSFAITGIMGIMHYPILRAYQPVAEAALRLQQLRKKAA